MEKDGPFRNTRASSSSGPDKNSQVGDLQELLETPKRVEREKKSGNNVGESGLNEKLRTSSGQILKPIGDIRAFFTGIANEASAKSSKSPDGKPSVKSARRHRRSAQKANWTLVTTKRHNRSKAAVRDEQLSADQGRSERIQQSETKPSGAKTNMKINTFEQENQHL